MPNLPPRPLPDRNPVKKKVPYYPQSPLDPSPRLEEGELLHPKPVPKQKWGKQTGMAGRLSDWTGPEGPDQTKWNLKGGMVEPEFNWGSKFRQQYWEGPKSVTREPIKAKVASRDASMARIKPMKQKDLDKYEAARAFAEEMKYKQRLKEGIPLDADDLHMLRQKNNWGLRL